MTFALANLTEYLAYFTEIITWVGTTFVSLLNVIIDSVLIIPVGIGIALMLLAVAWSYVKSRGGR